MVWRFAAISLVSVWGLTCQASGDPVVERLGKVKMFAFGGVGFASVMSQGEKDYGQVMSRAVRQEILEQLFKTGTVEAKSYALVGFLQSKSHAVQRPCCDATFIEIGSVDGSRLRYSQNDTGRCCSKA